MWFLNFLFGALFGNKSFGLDLDRIFNSNSLIGAIVGASTPSSGGGFVPLTSIQILGLGTAGVPAVTTDQIAYLTTDFVQLFTTDSIAALSSTQLGALTTIDVAALTSIQVVALTTAQFASMSTSNTTALTTGQIAAIETVDIQALNTAQIVTLRTDQVAALSTDQLTALTTSEIVALTTNQVAAITTQDIAALTPAQQALLMPSISALTTSAFAALTTARIASLTSAEIVSLRTDEIVAFTTEQVRALTTVEIRQLTTSQIPAFETADLSALKTTQIAAMNSDQTVVLTSDQVCSFSTAQIGAFTTSAYSQLLPVSPIILDMNGDGVKTMGISAGVKFDIFADGSAVNTGWVSSGDGLLVMDRNHDGKINDGSELFGSATRLANGEKAPDGYAALREMDTNHDGVISSADAAYADLRVWVDSNSDGLTEAGEVRTLSSLGIATINVNATEGSVRDHGNLLGLTSTYETTDGATHAAADVWFIADKNGANASAGTLDAAIAALNPPAAPVVAVDQSISASTLQTSPVDAIAPPDALTVPATPKDDLRSRATGLAQAIGAFGDTEIGSSGLSTVQLNGAGGVLSTATPASLAVVSMVDAMKQFDTNGNQVSSPVTTTTSSTKSLKLPGVQDPDSNGVLIVKND